jgi:hypothetical protein
MVPCEVFVVVVVVVVVVVAKTLDNDKRLLRVALQRH